jgi:hypothetical protein
LDETYPLFFPASFIYQIEPPPQNFDGTEVGPTIGLEDSKAFSVADMGEPASSAVSISSPGSVSIL